MSLVGEYDRRLVILTKERGRITAFARGVRKSNNQLVSKTQLFVMGEFTLYEGRDAYTLKSVEAKEYFHELTYDMEKYCYGSYFCEVMSYLTREGERSTDYLNLLFVRLRAHQYQKFDGSVVQNAKKPPGSLGTGRQLLCSFQDITRGLPSRCTGPHSSWRRHPS